MMRSLKLKETIRSGRANFGHAVRVSCTFVDVSVCLILVRSTRGGLVNAKALRLIVAYRSHAVHVGHMRKAFHQCLFSCESCSLKQATGLLEASPPFAPRGDRNRSTYMPSIGIDPSIRTTPGRDAAARGGVRRSVPWCTCASARRGSTCRLRAAGTTCPGPAGRLGAPRRESRERCRTWGRANPSAA